MLRSRAGEEVQHQSCKGCGRLDAVSYIAPPEDLNNVVPLGPGIVDFLVALPSRSQRGLVLLNSRGQVLIDLVRRGSIPNVMLGILPAELGVLFGFLIENIESLDEGWHILATSSADHPRATPTHFLQDVRSLF